MSEVDVKLEDGMRPIPTPGIGHGNEGWLVPADGNQVNIIGVGDYEEEVRQVVDLSDGLRTTDEIVEAIAEKGGDGDIAKILLSDLVEGGFFLDSARFYRAFHVLTQNPGRYSQPVSAQEVWEITSRDAFVPKNGQRLEIPPIQTEVGELATRRESCRDFSDAPVTGQEWVTCLHAAYSGETTPIPSAGGLYPLRMYAVVKPNGSDVPAGVYQYDHKNGDIIQFGDGVPDERISFAFMQEEALHNAPVIFVIAADLDRHPEKYGMRGYRFTMLEAGHAAQNMHLVAEGLGMNTLEYGGFHDQAVADLLDLPDGERPVITVALGHRRESGEDRSNLGAVTYILEGLIDPQNGPVLGLSSETSPDLANNLGFRHATAVYAKPNPADTQDRERYAGGTAFTDREARVKAGVEAYERWASGQVRVDVEAAAKDLSEEWINPDDIMPRTEAQRARHAHWITRFDVSEPIQWVRGVRPNGTTALVPVESAFYPISEEMLGRMPVARMSSNGVAAHTDRGEASRRALLELVERDAFMRRWVLGESPQQIDTAALPQFYQERAVHWEQQGKLVHVLDTSTEHAAVAMVIIRSADGSSPLMTLGMSASDQGFETALTKAYQESELSYAAAMSRGEPPRLKPEEVWGTRQHGDFYYWNDHHMEVSWLWEGKVMPTMPVPKNVENLLDVYQPVLVPLTRDDDPLQVVRAICPSLVSVTFGFGEEPVAHPAFAGRKIRPLNAPHPLA